ncbi:efflux RND transporter periplasmic adaptor subunit [Breznakiella homolactica]|uniref:Efflux RND transporter periplasmic adaptor subunit n=1 Tax=Breznakiella homolactica TaxID=2798577 RepID=A0A7T7XP03_9SPIR|nr:efflux RND transporter periplasmic adaptor subunit [Breznakiella homolactica]QQO09869.1 efflux RND transporter periplasmic adaptor subunit [Breznakiella homolactica]
MSKKVIIIVLAAAAAAGLVFVPSILAGSDTGSDTTVNANVSMYSVRVDQAAEQTLQAYLEINGEIVPEQQVAVLPDAAGKVVSVKIDLGSEVRKGQIIAEIDPSKPGTSYALSPVYAPISGIVTAPPAAVGSTVTTASTIATVSAMKNFEIEALIPEREVGQLTEGLKARITLQAFPGEVFSATVIRVSPVVDPNSRTKKIILSFDVNDSRINPGMLARVKLNTRTYEDVVTVPAEAVINVRGSSYVYVMEGIDRVALREVEKGVSIDNTTEIKSGLSGGESVVIQGQQFLTNGAAVKVIGTRSQA